MCKEGRAVLANAPSFKFDTAFAARGIQIVLRLAALAFLLTVKPREVLSDNFCFAVALDPFGAGIPADDPASMSSMKSA